jgi:hypothetical protein
MHIGLPYTVGNACGLERLFQRLIYLVEIDLADQWSRLRPSDASLQGQETKRIAIESIAISENRLECFGENRRVEIAAQRANCEMPSRRRLGMFASSTRSSYWILRIGWTGRERFAMGGE